MYYLRFDDNGFQIEACYSVEEKPSADGWHPQPAGYAGGVYKLVGDELVELETDEEKEAALNQQLFEPRMETLRVQRTRLLIESDWTQLADAPLTSAKKTAWATYRAALRDLPSTVQAGTNPLDVEFPTPPGA
jgi:hypothetical protein